MDHQGRLHLASVTDWRSWMEFDYAVSCARELGYGVGYCLHDSDPFTCIDLDVKNPVNAPGQPEKWTGPDELARYRSIVQHFASYTELSQSGQGAHVWVLGNIGKGRKRDGVEVYSRERFIICTGWTLHDLPIADRQAMLDGMAAQMETVDTELADDGVSRLTDEQVMRQFWNARNSAKFRMLWFGQWQGLGYPSQSEADQALMTQLAFYSDHNEQCRRLFRLSALGQRPKATDNDRYIDLTLRRARATHAPRLAAIKAAQEAMAPTFDRAAMLAEAARQRAQAPVIRWR